VAFSFRLKLVQLCVKELVYYMSLMGSLRICLVVSIILLTQKVNVGATKLALILIDDLGYNDAWTNGSDLSEAWTNVRKLGGVLVKTYYTTWLCTPARTALLTGAYPWRSGLHHNVIANFEDLALPQNSTTLPEKLRYANFTSHHIGKWHLGTYADSATPLRRGFDSSVGYLNGEIDHFNHTVNDLMDFYYTQDYSDFGTTMNGTYATSVFAYEAVQRVKEHANSSDNVFLYYALQNVHSPVEPPNQQIVQETLVCATIGCNDPHYGTTRRDLCGMATYADLAIGNVTSAIQQYWGWDSTLLIIAGDNGGIVAAGGNNAPLRGQKATPWEGGVRNHVIFKGLDLPDFTTYTNGFIHAVDIHATLLARALSKDEYNNSWPSLDGFDMYETLLNNSVSPRREVALMYDPCPQLNKKKECTTSTYAYRWMNWKLVKPGYQNDTWYHPPPRDANATCTNFTWLQWQETTSWLHNRYLPGPAGSVIDRLFHKDEESNKHRDLNAIYLYDLDNDIGETTDLASQYPDVLSTIQAKLDAVLAYEMAPCNIPNGTCYDDDPNGQDQCETDGYWSPWIHD